MMWDFWSHSPEALHQITILFSDRGIPDGYRHMHGFGSHTYSLINVCSSGVFITANAMLMNSSFLPIVSQSATNVAGDL